jgi:hypothetical protein
MAERTIWLHRDAPPKPAAGAACNGCGVCCAAEPCPAGMLLSLRVRGRCRLLRFEPAQSRYHCGLMPGPGARRAARARGALDRRRPRLRLDGAGHFATHDDTVDAALRANPVGVGRSARLR